MVLVTPAGGTLPNELHPGVVWPPNNEGGTVKQKDLFDSDSLPPFVRGSDTSESAAESMAEHAPTLRLLVFKCIADQVHGATCDEVEVALRLRHQTVSARIRELARDLKIMDTGYRRQTRSGRHAVVWKAVV